MYGLKKGIAIKKKLRFKELRLFYLYCKKRGSKQDNAVFFTNTAGILIPKRNLHFPDMRFSKQ